MTSGRSGAQASLRSVFEPIQRSAWRHHPREWLRAARACPPALVHALALGLTVLAAVADAATSQYSLLVLYLAPVGLAGWRFGRRVALAWSAIAAALGLAATLWAGAPAGSVAYWNALADLGILAAVGLAVGSVRALADLTRSLAGTDPLTGVVHGASFQELVELERSRALRYNRPFTLAYLSVDRLRDVNELRGRATGDRALQLIARTIRQNIRSMDSVSRLGGDEFGLLLPETGRGSAEVALGKIATRLDEAALEYDLDISFSVGAVICVGAPESVDRLISRADALMHQVKHGGGGGVALDVLDDEFGIEAILQRG